jgi:hypothetical protein
MTRRPGLGRIAAIEAGPCTNVMATNHDVEVEQGVGFGCELPVLRVLEPPGAGFNLDGLRQVRAEGTEPRERHRVVGRDDEGGQAEHLRAPLVSLAETSTAS